MIVRIEMKLSVVTPPTKDRYGKEETEAQYRTEMFEVQEATVAEAVARAKKILDIV